MNDKLISEMENLLYKYGINPDAFESAMKEFYQNHSFTKHVAVSYLDDAMGRILMKAYRWFMKREKRVIELPSPESGEQK